jgi:3-deoxy-D-arabino-heptulosonate 7-phosphate (DAHP) synthase class II
VPPRDTPLWQPERISDPDLQTLARRYNEVTRDLRVRARFGNQQVKETLPELVTQSEALEVEITRRMDELEWPEVDD